ncbi:hypothetical protein FOPG_17932 [Fusarium oxysporum f. sp. conglutinans race 2 54008]|uniref:Uncharacterized protein n=1 Tax=Fusarium oxysporum f. sp. conglutinans race 2 54008 TaxID=1089457 RepID=X0H1B7_FUSOX|nr:hypothetical protein FOPG_17932 [Fusarium oxysporum f. sp. conglutinans race 2 54008]KAG6978562.1 hypothetical protein FocnCong_v011765 [Fusarium oxysporum f. sp. conglutinans]KAI8397302.1 hypothetical protein FOFC_20574 [Fusarium oxysporum]
MPKARQNYDDVAWNKNDEAFDDSQKQLRHKTTCRLVESLAESILNKRASLSSPIFFGGFNVIYRLRPEGDPYDVIVRLPCPDLAQFPEEKTLYEAATMLYLAQNTKIPIPTLFHHTMSSDVGPAILLQRVENIRDMSDALTIPDQNPEETPVLNPNIDEAMLRDLYKRIALVLMQLSAPSFTRIGSLVKNDSGDYAVAGRPITQNMNNMIQLANIPRSVLPLESQTYESADDWYIALAGMHMAQLLFQHNDLVCSEDDCRNKYVARRLFHSLAKQGRLSTFGFIEDDWSGQSKITKFKCSMPSGSDSFRLWCDDLKPANLLLNQKDDIVAAIDWEFTYVAPTQFSLDPPWWLLLEVPEMWSSGIDDWADAYDVRLKTWLLAMEDVEGAAASSMPFKLSTYMHESWVSGRFWLDYASRKSWAFDTIFWKYLDERFFGPRDRHVPQDKLWTTRIDLLEKGGIETMDLFVQRKMDEIKERVLVDWDPIEAKKHLNDALGVNNGFESK